MRLPMRIKNYDNLYKDPRLSTVTGEVFKEELERYFSIDKVVEKDIVVEEPVFIKKEKEYEYFTIDIIEDITNEIENKLYINWEF